MIDKKTNKRPPATQRDEENLKRKSKMHLNNSFIDPDMNNYAKLNQPSQLLQIPNNQEKVKPRFITISPTS